VESPDYNVERNRVPPPNTLFEKLDLFSFCFVFGEPTKEKVKNNGQKRGLKTEYKPKYN
jgi:hypothetical protein